VLRINLTGSFLTAQAAARRMVAQGGGRIIQIGSISGQRGNMGGVEAVANAALFLASDECQWITGHVLNVDGGYGAAGIAYDPAEIAVP
jgi:NAD(P)-dependent dehydrogenase (short-subunit alcohol dehydrogenase family)